MTDAVATVSRRFVANTAAQQKPDTPEPDTPEPDVQKQLADAKQTPQASLSPAPLTHSSPPSPMQDDALKTAPTRRLSFHRDMLDWSENQRRPQSVSRRLDLQLLFFTSLCAVVFLVTALILMRR